MLGRQCIIEVDHQAAEVMCQALAVAVVVLRHTGNEAAAMQVQVDRQRSIALHQGPIEQRPGAPLWCVDMTDFAGA